MKVVTSPPVSLVIADPHPLFRTALRHSLDQDDTVEVRGEAENAEQALQKARWLEPQVLLLDEKLLGDEPGEFLRRAAGVAPETRVLVMSAAESAGLLLQVLEHGGQGVVGRSLDMPGLLKALELASSRELIFQRSIMGDLIEQVIAERRAGQASRELLERLTRREREVLQLLVDGASNADVAKALVISPQTARTHIQNTMQKLGVHSRVEAAALAARYGLTAAPDAPSR